jgi:type VI secretion system secreted protein Hcp
MLNHIFLGGKKMKARKTILTAISLAVLLAVWAVAGNLEPSAAPGPTMKTLDEVYAAASSAPTDDPVPDIADIQGAKAIHMTLTGETQGNILGNCTVVGREDTIGIIGIEHSVASARDAASGLPTGRRQHKPITITKRIDKSTPLLYNVLTNNENITDLTLSFFQKSDKGQLSIYYSIHLLNASIAEIKQIDTEREQVSFCYEKITWTFEDGGMTADDDWETPNV